MQVPNYPVQSVQELSDKEFQTIARYIESTVGIKMPDTKRIMMQSRLMRRLRVLKMNSFSEYIDYVFNSKNSDELVLMIDVLTTNKTEFFRENEHFEYLTNKILPEFAETKNTIKIWSAGCSSGEEPYTISMVISEFMKSNPGKIVNFKVTGTDISTNVLDKAYNAVYDLDLVEQLPMHLKKSYFLKCTNREMNCARIKPELRKHVSFKRLNFMDADFRMPEVYDIIFCRNVLIYFDKATQEKVIMKFMKYLQPEGYLFLGHSETIFSMDLPLRTCIPTVYKKVIKAL